MTNLFFVFRAAIILFPTLFLLGILFYRSETYQLNRHGYIFIFQEISKLQDISYTYINTYILHLLYIIYNISTYIIYTYVYIYSCTHIYLCLSTCIELNIMFVYVCMSLCLCVSPSHFKVSCVKRGRCY